MSGFREEETEEEEVEEEIDDEEPKRVSKEEMKKLNNPKPKPAFVDEEDEMPGDDDPELNKTNQVAGLQEVYKQGFNEGFVQASSLAFQAMIGLTKKEVK